MSDTIGNLISIKACRNFNDTTYNELNNSLSTSNKNKNKLINKWTNTEINILKDSIKIFGYDFDMIKNYIKTKTRKQIKNKFKKLELINIRKFKLDEENIKNLALNIIN